MGYINNLRPLTVPNCDYKIITKNVGNSLKDCITNNYSHRSKGDC